MNIVIASSEVGPFAKTGGLADVCGALPVALNRLGHQVTVFLPAFRSAFNAGQEIKPANIEFTVPVGAKRVTARLLESRLPDSDVPVYLIDQPAYFDREQLYGEGGQDYEDNAARFVLFNRAVLEAINHLDLAPDVIHANDWQTSLIPAYLKTEYAALPRFQRIASVLTIHNLAYQGRFWHWDMLLTGLDWKYFNWRQMEFYGQLNFLKTGIVFADAINTVSHTYAREIQTAEHGYGLDGVLQSRQNDLFGILNGIDPSIWNPATDTHLPQPYDVSNWKTGKRACKQHLQTQVGLEPNLDKPLIGIVGRLASQKGWSLILPMMRQWLQSIDVQWVLLGTGQVEFENALRQLQRAFPQRLSANLRFSDALAHLIEAGSDMFLMPSQYEPCGLNQMYSMAYGTVPIVRRTGGLADTVIDANTENIAAGVATGFLFDSFEQPALEHATARAVHCLTKQPDAWAKIVERGMKQDWSWDSSARNYVELYQQACVLHCGNQQHAM